MFDKGKTVTAFFHKTEMHMGGREEWRFIKIQILRNYNWNVSPATDKKTKQKKTKPIHNIKMTTLK